MWTQVWPIKDLQRLDRESRKIMVENGGKYPLVTCSISQGELEEGDLSRSKGSTSSLRSLDLVRQFKKKARRIGRHSLIGDAQRFAKQFGMKLELRCLHRVKLGVSGSVYTAVS